MMLLFVINLISTDQIKFFFSLMSFTFDHNFNDSYRLRLSCYEIKPIQKQATLALLLIELKIVNSFHKNNANMLTKKLPNYFKKRFDLFHSIDFFFFAVFSLRVIQ